MCFSCTTYFITISRSLNDEGTCAPASLRAYIKGKCFLFQISVNILPNIMMLIDYTNLKTNIILTNCQVIFLTMVFRNCQSQVLPNGKINNLTFKVRIRVD